MISNRVLWSSVLHICPFMLTPERGSNKLLQFLQMIVKNTAKQVFLASDFDKSEIPSVLDAWELCNTRGKMI